MLYWFLYEYIFKHYNVGPFRIFRYLTFRTAFASVTALFMGLIIGPAIIHRLREFQIGQYIREEGPKAHQKKAGTPTMGGILIVIAIIVPTVLWSDLSNLFVWLTIFATLAYGGIGFADDYLKVAHKQNLGLTARSKMLLQILFGVIVAVALILMQARGLYSTHLIVPFLKRLRPDLVISGLMHNPYLWPIAFMPFMIFVTFVIVGASNTVNLTDGLDGLAIGCTLIAAAALTVLTYVSGHAVFADYLELQRMPQVGELTVFCGAMVGASIGFLWYNAHPAEVFMGDVGSLALGGAIGTVAVIIKQELLLPFIGGVFVIEGLSVILQVGSYKLRKKRIFKMAPLHHHFELLGWSESKVIVRFWIASLVFALFALTTLKLR
ncbi:MAG TPA: phospho-N-acetylmuramoyl-pentapeptide-transferase [Candidatus Acidoferrales bacterium]|nr:phospho-N-acetylmuramoyl-pentapeptide-transferase [Candidatus Acidoferrales bacterium]